VLPEASHDEAASARGPIATKLKNFYQVSIEPKNGEAGRPHFSYLPTGVCPEISIIFFTFLSDIIKNNPKKSENDTLFLINRCVGG